MSEEVIVRTYSDMVFKIAYGYVKNTDDCADVFQEVFLTYFKKPRHFEGEEHRKAWLIRVTINCAKDFLREKSHHASLEDLPWEGATQDSPDDGGIRAAIEALEPQSRTAVFLYYYEQLSVHQISLALELNENTVKTKLARARKRLAGELQEYLV